MAQPAGRSFSYHIVCKDGRMYGGIVFAEDEQVAKERVHKQIDFKKALINRLIHGDFK